MFDRPKPTTGCTANGRRRRGGGVKGYLFKPENVFCVKQKRNT